jgi:hypothetical protein
LATVHLEPRALGETLESDHIEVEGMEPLASKERDGSGIPSPLPKIMADEVMGLPTENWFSGPTFVDDPTTIGPSNGRTSRESIKLARETINWLSDPLAALSGLIPMTLTMDDVALSPKEAMDKMSHHFLDVSFSSFLAIHMTSLIGLGELTKIHLLS